MSAVDERDEPGKGRGFADANDYSLWRAHAHLLGGLDRVAAAIEAGTFEQVGPKNEASPAQSGQLTLGLLVRCAEELAYRIAEGRTSFEDEPIPEWERT